jgi:transcription initiation factor TFIID TATA-box-binding protein
MRLREPRATALVFASGKLVITGTKSSHNSSLATKKIAYILERVGFRPSDHINFKIQNIVGTVDCGFPIRLEGVAFAHPSCTSYEPELFPGLIYRLSVPKAVLLIFVSGKVVITGAKTEEILVEGLKKVFPVLLEFRKMQVTSMPDESIAAVTAGGSTDVTVPSLPPMAASTGRGKGGVVGVEKAAPRVRRGKDLQNVAQIAMSDS